MILQALNELYDRLSDDPDYGIAAPGFSNQKITFNVVLNAKGNLVDIQDARIPNAKGKLTPAIVQVPGSEKPSGSGMNPGFLWDNQTYLLGRQPLEKDNKKADFGLERFAAFRDRHLGYEDEIDSEWFGLVCQFLRSWSPASITSYPILDSVGPGFGIFTIQGHKLSVHEDPAIHSWWRKNRPTEPDLDQSQCLITGKDTAIARTHPKIKGVGGAQSSGALLVSFNATAYESFGMDQGQNSPIGAEAAFRYGSSLNALLDGPQKLKHRIRIGDTTSVFWTDSRVIEDCFAAILKYGSNAITEVQDPGQLSNIKRGLSAIKKGGAFQDLGENLATPFYILGLAPNAARLSVRFFHRSTTAQLFSKLHDHQQCLKIIQEFPEPRGKHHADAEFPAIWHILKETARVSDEIPPLLAGATTRAVLEGTPYPESLFTAILLRIRADRTVNYLRAATLKAVLVRNHKLDIPIMLDNSRTDPAYRLGRLFAALEKTQEDALGILDAGIRDRYYSGASATPANVFPRLLKTYQHHLGKMSGGMKVNRERLVQEIFDPLSDFPTQLNLKNQGVFAIGYYHQRKYFFTKKAVTESAVELS